MRDSPESETSAFILQFQEDSEALSRSNAILAAPSQLDAKAKRSFYGKKRNEDVAEHLKFADVEKTDLGETVLEIRKIAEDGTPILNPRLCFRIFNPTKRLQITT
jgi:hypothetical protein